jgi:hypothetical protein
MDTSTPDRLRIRRWRLRAEECRTLADHAKDPSARGTLLDVADKYDHLAAQAETRPGIPG